MQNVQPSNIPGGGAEVWVKGEPPTHFPPQPISPGCVSKYDKSDVQVIGEEDVWFERRSGVERPSPKTAFAPSTRVWGRRLTTVLMVLLGCGVGFLLGITGALVTYKVTEPTQVAVTNMAARHFCEGTEGNASPFATQCAQGAPFANTFVTFKINERNFSATGFRHSSI